MIGEINSNFIYVERNGHVKLYKHKEKNLWAFMYDKDKHKVTLLWEENPKKVWKSMVNYGITFKFQKTKTLMEIVRGLGE